ncbi:MAG: hypothetical protein KF799_08500 [Bdellovibrionales bacterium]|nr:hypothetical protein [Bdellovibrionales bacterium]
MKFMIAAAFAVLAAGAALWLMKPSKPTVESPKYSVVEPETKVRPERFEAMKFDPSATRMPASTNK